MEKFISIKPQSEILKKHIDSFYFHCCDKYEGSKKIVFFPNLNNALTIYNRATFSVKNTNPKHFEVKKSSHSNFIFLYGGIQQNYIISDMQAPFDKIGIIFKPLGINHFTNLKNLGLLLKEDYHFPYFEQSMNDDLVQLFKTTIVEERAKILETFFLKSFNPNYKDELVEKAIHIIENSNHKIRVKDIAAQVHVSEKTLDRKFLNNLNCKPKHYIKVFHFRNSLNQFYDAKGETKLINLALDNFYYDQSDFIKNFKTLTGQNPMKILNEATDLGNNIYWIK